WADAAREPLAADASFRRYIRLRKNGQSVLVMDAPPPKENVRPFIAIARHLVGLGLSAPSVLAEDHANGFLLLEDFGDDTFTRLLGRGEPEQPLYRLAVDTLIHLHSARRAAMLPGLPAYEATLLLAEVALLADWFVPAISGEPLSPSSRRAHDDAWRAVFPLLASEPPALVLRDFHVDNLMRVAGRAGVAACGLLDFQDAVAGPKAYDLLSLLEDARRDVPHDMAAELRARYTASMPDLRTPDCRRRFDVSYAVLAAQRHAKVIGIFTRLAVRDGKPVYLAHIPCVWRLLDRALEHDALAPVADWFRRTIPRDLRRSPPWPPKGC
ncbi:MAG: phosphotransferase, partial [Proteobacteria bacterium]|nr:phosphotransferase [Pseudomonadota bacterium]